MPNHLEEALTFDDVLLLPAYSSVLPKQAILHAQLTSKIHLKIPILSAAMDTVTESRLAIALAELGGIGILHKNMSAEQQAIEVRKVKKSESGVVTHPITISPHATVAELLHIQNEYHISGVPVVEGQQLIGIITNRDIRFVQDFNQKVAQLMTQKGRLITVLEGTPREEILNLFRAHRVEKILIVNHQFDLKGMITVTDILRSEKNPEACKTQAGQLCVGAAIGVTQDTPVRVSLLVEEGVDLIVIDTAHGFSENVLKQVRWLRAHYPDLEIMAGNVATADAALALYEAGANAIKVGIGPGSICTTRIISGVGVPQVTAIHQVSQALKGKNVGIVADGGIRFSGDVAKAIAAGASAVMIGGLLAGTEEAPGAVFYYQGQSYKAYRGMGSVSAMAQPFGSKDRYSQEISETNKYVPEGVEARVPYRGSLTAMIHQLMGGLRSCMGYTGCIDLEALRTQARFIKITAAGARESHVHDVTIMQEAPNYRIDDSHS